ncbi:hypothetical protein ASPWEDRAFT_187270 [Aspergillus wentii DTO 134E9]|uniref:TauD/TfdA-like domain-containing protein n=1 Tax=Aspergillus wentii DTO 134E9 TaxID=1073089 RepID=A0A1L9R8Z7_ASPWE|nr:uncharacterized protein ASPWEDRAFT_187270 [Aspergillus wentii DTO 134E9]OJJ31390.1 hypothetical protein ASPWEDRAFT_187270 [Aspergillus wentii DTO 134E9]
MSPVESIPYYPDRAQYDARVLDHLQRQPAQAALPAGFPAELDSDMVWEGSDLNLEESAQENRTKLMVLNTSQLAEIDAALSYFQTLSKSMHELDPSTFPSPSLHPVLRAVSDNLHYGYGFTLIRGIPVTQYTREENMIIYVGVSAHIASNRGLINLRSLEDKQQNFSLAAYSDGEVIFHTDVGDIVSLFTLDEAASGGESLLASGWRVYNELAKNRPDLIRVLAEDWPIPNGKQPDIVTHRPLLFYQPPAGDAPERRNLLNSAQAEALDALHFLAEKFHVSMQLQRGDMQFINNMSMIHARNSYQDDENHTRYLLRLWLRDPENAWTAPEPLQARKSRLYDEEFSYGPQVFPLDPSARSAPPS